MERISGITASQGFAYAKAFIIHRQIQQNSMIETNYRQELTKFNDALKIAKAQISDLKTTSKQLDKATLAIFDTHLLMLEDPLFLTAITDLIKTKTISAAYAIQEISNRFQQQFQALDDSYMRERAHDIFDISNRLINILNHKKNLDLSLIDEEVIIVANDLTPSETSQLNPKYVKGFITATGGKTSHSAIIARTLSIPSIVGIGDNLDSFHQGDFLIIDSEKSQIIINPDKKVLQQFKIKQENFLANNASLLEYINKQTLTKDKKKLLITANISSLNNLESLDDNGAEGVGLFRTEFLYMDSSDWPDEEKQFATYKKLLIASKNQEVVIRTLDIGGDKNLEYFKFPPEMNPFLGYRAIRLQLNKITILEQQFRALLRASAFGNLAISIPMISNLDEFHTVKNHFLRIEKNLKSEGIKVGRYKLGIMVEVPSVVWMIDKFAKYVDFFSIGTNDLTQYTFAVDRNSKTVAYLYQSLNPSLLKQLNLIIQTAHKFGKPVTICGEIAAEFRAIPLLVGMKLDKFSMATMMIPRIRKLISQISQRDAIKLVNTVLNCETENEVIDLIDEFLTKNLSLRF